MYVVGYLPEVTKDGKEVWPRGEEETWKAGLKDVSTGMCFDVFGYRDSKSDVAFAELPQITNNIVHHVQTTLARQA